MGPSRPTSARANRYYEPAADQPKEHAVLVGVHFVSPRPQARSTWADLDELERLADTAGAIVKGRLEQRRAQPDVRSLIGKGKAQQLKQLVGSLQADLVIFDNDLSPAQGRNLEKLLGCRVIDRTELILDIFARHAHTRQARLQVALAQYEYLLPRLARMWKHLERQAGGIGTRGPGEAQIETDRRIIRRRIGQLRRELKAIERQMATQHKRRESQYRVTLVGYTNAGKSSLMNQIADADVYVEDQLFATLDATTRRVETKDGHTFLLTDTVGFIRNLPHHLIESFRATLGEVNEADLLFHVVDGASEDADAQIQAVEEVLRSVCEESKPTRLVINKIDTLSHEQRERLRRFYPGAFLTSAVTGEGLPALLEDVSALLRAQERQLVLRVSNEFPRTMSRIHELTDVLKVEYLDGHATVRLRVDGPNFGRLLQLDGIEVLEVARIPYSRVN